VSACTSDRVNCPSPAAGDATSNQVTIKPRNA
jgi:hypothetical protein